MTAAVLPFRSTHLTVVPPLRPALEPWNPPWCPSWCAGHHDIPGCDHSHWTPVGREIDTANDHQIFVYLRQEEHEDCPVIAVDIDDAPDGPEMTVREAEALIRALRKAVRKARRK